MFNDNLIHLLISINNVFKAIPLLNRSAGGLSIASGERGVGQQREQGMGHLPHVF